MLSWKSSIFTLIIIISCKINFTISSSSFFSNQKYPNYRWSNSVFPSLNKKLSSLDFDQQNSFDDEQPWLKNRFGSNFELQTENNDAYSFRRINPEIRWRHCSAKKIKVYEGEDVKIRCEMWAPHGSTVIWYKNKKPQRRSNFDNFSKIKRNKALESELDGRSAYKIVNAPEVQEEEEEKNNIEFEATPQKPNSEFLLMSIFYVDCMQPNDEELYEIQIVTPSGNKYSRFFRLVIVGIHPKYNSKCPVKILYQKYGLRSRFSFDPRISDFAKKVSGKYGQELLLPCRPLKLRNIIISWDFFDRQITEKDYSVTPKGDLIIHKLDYLDNGTFKCTVSDITNATIVYDRSATTVKVLD